MIQCNVSEFLRTFREYLNPSGILYNLCVLSIWLSTIFPDWFQWCFYRASIPLRLACSCSECTIANNSCYLLHSWCLWHQVTLLAMRVWMSRFSASSQGYLTTRAVTKICSHYIFLARKTLLSIEYIMYISVRLRLHWPADSY